MAVKHRIPFGDCDILVDQKGEQTFHVTIQARTNPLSKGNLLKICDEEEAAVQAAELFFKVYTKAKENGYYLQEQQLIKPNRDPIPITRFFDGTLHDHDWVC